MKSTPNPDAAVCDFCGQILHLNGHKESVDIMITTSYYAEEDGTCIGTLEQAPPEVDTDYLVFCPDCKDDVVRAWNEMLFQLTQKGLKI